MSKNDIALSCTACSALAHSLLQHCSEGSLEQVGQSKRCNTFKKGQIMFFEGNNPLGIYCVRSGTIKLYKIGLGGKEQIVRLAKPGDLLGYRAVLAEETYALSAAVLEDATACFIPRDEFVAALEQHPELYRQTLKSLCSELGVMQERLQSMAQRSVRERLAGIVEDGEALRLLSGGSVKAGTPAQLFARPDIDGALVGGASLDADAFAAIVRAAATD